MRIIGRRALIIGSSLLGLAAAAGVILSRANQRRQQKIAAARADYLAGRVDAIDGWIVSETEASDAPDTSR